MEAQPLLDALSRFTRSLVFEERAIEVLQELTGTVTQLIGLSGAVATLLHEGPLRIADTSRSALVMVEGTGVARRGGPSVVAGTTGAPVLVPDLWAPGTQRRWPDYCARARAAGLRAVAAVPMRSEGQVVGTLALYDARARTWTHDDLQVAVVLSDIATSRLVHVGQLDRQRTRTVQLQQALDSRIVIEQAKGALAAAYDISVDEAFERLRRHARDHNTRLHEVAHAVVQLGLRP